jgi:hypothetical protein
MSGSVTAACCSCGPIRETQEMVFNAHVRAFALHASAASTTIYGRLRARRSIDGGGGMHESIRPVAGPFVPLLMGVRCFSPHNMIGLEGLVVDQAWTMYQFGGGAPKEAYWEHSPPGTEGVLAPLEPFGGVPGDP